MPRIEPIRFLFATDELTAVRAGAILPSNATVCPPRARSESYLSRDRSPFPTTDVLLESVASSPTVPTTFHHAKSGSLNSNIDILRLFASFVCQQFSRIRVLVSRVRLECLELVYQGIPIFGRGSSLNVGQFVEL